MCDYSFFFADIARILTPGHVTVREFEAAADSTR